MVNGDRDVGSSNGMSEDEARRWIDNAEIGAKLRGRRGPRGAPLYHVRGVVDHCLVIRHWSIKRGWIYEVVDELFLVYGALVPEKQKAAVAAALRSHTEVIEEGG